LGYRRNILSIGHLVKPDSSARAVCSRAFFPIRPDTVRGKGRGGARQSSERCVGHDGDSTRPGSRRNAEDSGWFVGVFKVRIDIFVDGETWLGHGGGGLGYAPW
jgi:hypothetical protein